MINGEIFLEKTIMYTVKYKLFMVLILILEYLIIFVECINTVSQAQLGRLVSNQDKALYWINFVNPYFFFYRSSTCTTDSIGQNVCSFSSNIIFYLSFGVYFLIYLLYKLKYEKPYRESPEYLDREQKENIGYLENPSKIQFLIINFFNCVLRPFSVFLFFISFNTLTNSILNFISSNSVLNINFLLLIMSVFFILFQIVFDFKCLKASCLMFNHLELQSHFDCFFSMKYDTLMLALKVGISLDSNFQLMDLYTGNLRIMMNLLINFIVIIYTLTIVSDISAGKVVMITNFDLNFFRFFFLVYNSVFIIFLMLFFDSHQNMVLMVISLIFNFILSYFMTRYLIKYNEVNIMNDQKLIYMLIYLFEISNDSKSINRVSSEFGMRHKKICKYYLRHKDKNHLENDHAENDLLCYICLNDDPEGVRLSTLKLQMKYNKKLKRLTLDKTENQYLRLIKLFLKNSEEDIISLVYKTNKLLSKAEGEYYAFIRIFYNMISFKGKNQESLKRYTDIKKILETTSLFSDALKNLHTTYDTFKFVNTEIYNMADKLSTLKHKIYQNLNQLLNNSKNKNMDNYPIIIQKYIFENMFNDERLFKGERNFYDYEEYLSSNFNDCKVIEICYDYPKSSLQITNTPNQFIEYYNMKFESIFPADIQAAQKEKFIGLIQKTTSNNFDFECFIKNLKDPQYISRARFSCTISYSLEMSEFLIQAKYHPIDEEIIMGMEERNQVSIMNLSQNLGQFLQMPSNYLKLYRKFGFRVSLDDIFKHLNSEDTYEFNFGNFYNFYFKLANDLVHQYQYNDTLQMLEKAYKNDTSVKNNIIFKISQKGMIRNFIFYSVNSDFYKEKESGDKGKTGNTVAINDILLQQEHTSSGSSTGSGFREGMGLDRGGKMLGRDKALSQEKKNTDKLKVLSNSLGIFSVLVIFYCIFFMIIGILNNVRMNQSFMIKSSYDNIERSFYHTTTNLLNNIIILHKGDNMKRSLEDGRAYFDKFYNNPNITIDFLQFLKDETHIKVDDILNAILDFEILISSSYYQTTVNSIFSKMYDYYSFSTIGGQFGTVVNKYSFFDTIKIFMNNIKLISDDQNFWQYISIISYKENIKDFNNIASLDLTKNQLKTYEILINYVNIYKSLNELKSSLETFHEDNLDSIFSQSFYLSYILMAIHLFLVIISVLLTYHLKHIMQHSLIVISDLIKNEKNFKLMKRKLDVMRDMNKFYANDPNIDSKKLSKIRKELEQNLKADDKKSEEKMKKNIGASERNLSPKKMVDDFKQLSPIVKLMIILLTVYYSYSIICTLLLKIASDDIIVATDFLKLNNEKFKRLINTQNLLQIQLLTNRTGTELYKEVLGTQDGDTTYVSYLGSKIFSSWKSFQFYSENYKLFEPLNSFFENDLSCQYLYYSTSDTIYNQLVTRYKVTNSTVDLPKSLTTICEMFNVISSKDYNLVEEEIIYTSNKLIFQYKETNYEYSKMKNLFNSNYFNDLLMLIIIILKPLQIFLSDNVIHLIELNCFQAFLMYSMIYLVLNIIVDFTILLIYNNFIIFRIKKINDNLINLVEIIKIY